MIALNHITSGPGLPNWRLVLLALAAILVAPVTYGDEGEVVERIDFTDKPSGNAIPWLQENGFEFKLNARGLNPYFRDDALVLESESQRAGLIYRDMDLTGVNRVRITWGVERFPEGADWDNGVYRVPIAVMFSFGDEPVNSGSLIMPDAPYFIGLFLGKNEQEDHAYTARYYKEGGRYFCKPCNIEVGKTVTTVFDFDDILQEEFGVSPSLPVTRFGFQMNTLDTAGGARAFLKSVEFLAPASTASYQQE
ncbi:MAG: hypothetical protein U5P41_09725 [Gammaproteobacteria bacterium]|nr:hypothetical protein [Gammaproteobacteria bacterium]